MRGNLCWNWFKFNQSFAFVFYFFLQYVGYAQIKYFNVKITHLVSVNLRQNYIITNMRHFDSQAQSFRLPFFLLLWLFHVLILCNLTYTHTQYDCHHNAINESMHAEWRRANLTAAVDGCRRAGKLKVVVTRRDAPQIIIGKLRVSLDSSKFSSLRYFLLFA